MALQPPANLVVQGRGTRAASSEAEQGTFNPRVRISKFRRRTVVGVASVILFEGTDNETEFQRRCNPPRGWISEILIRKIGVTVPN